MNMVLAGLSAETFAAVEPHLCDTTLGEIADSVSTDHVDFVVSGVMAITSAPEGSNVEVALVGREGICGLSAALGGGPSPFGRQVVVDGEAFRIEAIELRKAMDEAVDLRCGVERYALARSLQVVQAVHAASRHSVELRLAGWILSVHDRMPGDEISVTHEQMARLLGVRRPGVTVALQLLEGRRLIRNSRRRIFVLDRQGLEAHAGDAYAYAGRDYGALFPDETVAALAAA